MGPYELLKVEECGHLLWNWLMILFGEVLLRVSINLYDDKSNPVGREGKMLVSQRGFEAVDERTALSSLPKGSF